MKIKGIEVFNTDFCIIKNQVRTAHRALYFKIPNLFDFKFTEGWCNSRMPVIGQTVAHLLRTQSNTPAFSSGQKCPNSPCCSWLLWKLTGTTETQTLWHTNARVYPKKPGFCPSPSQTSAQHYQALAEKKKPKQTNQNKTSFEAQSPPVPSVTE